MNNDIVNNETILLCYRPRTKRQRKRAQHKGFEKKLRALDSERQDLWQKKQNLGWVDLDKPVMRGWKRFFVLRDNVANSIHAEFFKSILDKIGTVTFSNRKDFKARKKRVRKWKYEAKKQELLMPEAGQFKKLNFSEKEQLFFEEKTIMNPQKAWVKVYEFKDPWRFVLKIKPNMITRSRVRNVEMESRLAELDNYFERNYLKPALFKLKGDSYNWYKEWRDELRGKDDRRFKNIPLPKLLDAIEDNKYI